MNSEGNLKYLQEELRFKIGEQYELNEFNLKSIDSTFENSIEYENYEYIKGDFKTLFDVNLSKNVILQYNADILSGLIYRLDLKDLDSLIEKLNEYLSFDRKLDTQKHVSGQVITVFSFQEISLTLDVEKDLRLRVFKPLG